MTPTSHAAGFLSRFKDETEKAKAELAGGPDDPYYRAKAFYRACEPLSPLAPTVIRIRTTPTPPSPTARGEQYDPALHATQSRKAFQ